MTTARRAKTERSGERMKCKWRERGGQKGGTGPIVVREFARQEHYQEKMFRDCALERDVFGSLVRSPRSPAPEDCPVSSLSTTLSCDHYCRLPRRLPRRSHPIFFPPFSFNRNVMSVVRRARRRKSAQMYTRGCDVSVIRIAFNRAERSIRCEWRSYEKQKISQTLNCSKIFLSTIFAFSLPASYIGCSKKKL